jgi:predicted nuclease with TOPRIM domain
LEEKSKKELIKEIEEQNQRIEWMANLIESLCGERSELKSEISILQAIISTSIPDLQNGKN